MPKISQAFGTKTISLPSYPDSEVVLITSPTVEQIMSIEKLDGELEKAVTIASKMVLSWNFTDEKDAPLPVTTDAIKGLPTADLEFLLETIAPFIEKKNPSPKA